MIKINKLNKSFGKLPVLKQLSIDIPGNFTTAVVGPNGSGKTTLIKILLGLTKADSGSVCINDFILNGDPSYRGQIGYMPQYARFPENLTVKEIFNMITDLRGKTDFRENDLFKTFRLERALEKQVRTLSGGTRQKINAVLAFMFDPMLIILDEPTAGLDPLASRILKQKILDEKKNNKTILITSHIMTELEELCDNLVFLVEGSIKYSGLIADLFESAKTRQLENAIASMMQEFET